MNKKLIRSVALAAVFLGMLVFASSSKADDLEDCFGFCAQEFDWCVQQCNDDKNCTFQCEQNQLVCEDSCQKPQ